MARRLTPLAFLNACLLWLAGGSAAHSVGPSELNHCDCCPPECPPPLVSLCVPVAATPHPLPLLSDSPHPHPLCLFSPVCTRAGGWRHTVEQRGRTRRCGADTGADRMIDPRAILHSQSCISIGAQAKTNGWSAPWLALPLSRHAATAMRVAHRGGRGGEARRSAISRTLRTHFARMLCICVCTRRSSTTRHSIASDSERPVRLRTLTPPPCACPPP